MSVKMLTAQLAATAAGVALLTGGAVRVAEDPVTESPVYASDIKGGKLIKGKIVPQTPRYIKREREIPKPIKRKRRIVERTLECAPVDDAGAAASATASTSSADGKSRIVETYTDAAECRRSTAPG